MRQFQENNATFRYLHIPGYVTALALLLLAVCTCLSFSHTLATTKHGCAPNVPPPVSGSPILASATPGVVLINEVLNQPQTTWNCSEPAGVVSLQEDSWIELYNTQTQPLDLDTAHAELSIDGETSWQYLPSGSAIAAGGFLVVFPLIGRTTPPPTTWDVALVIGSTVIDQVTVPTLQPDQSYARIPDGSSTWADVGAPTIDASNNVSDLPATATPTKTPKPTKTPTGTGAKASSPSSSVDTLTPLPANNGTQPPWGLVQLPTSTPTSTPFPGPAPGPSTTRSGPTSSLSASNGVSTILITILLLLLAATIFWCWKLFRSP